MKYSKELVVVVVVFLSALCSSISAQNIENGKEYPIPKGNVNQLFFLQRDENINTVVYELNKKNGSLDTQNPIHVFWIMYTKQEQQQDLSEMENKFAYGIKIKQAINEEYQFTLVAYSKITLYLKKDAGKRYRVYVTPLKKKMILHKTFIKVKQGGFSLEPKVEYIDFTGKDILTGKEITERIIP
ncbi:MAG: DUF4833 domain-containing protein [Bacteroidia bacterium]